MELEKLMRPHEMEQVGVAKLTDQERQALLQWGLRMFRLGQYVVGDIQEIKYDGRLIVLDDGSRWEVDSIDVSTADLWMPMDKVVVIDDTMYKLDEFDRITVQREDV